MLIRVVFHQRDRALEISPYGTLRELHFLKLYITLHPFYPEVLSRLCESSHTFLDIGCCFGQSIRKLVYDGAPSSSLYGIDMESAFWSLGYELFLDQGKLESEFMAGDIFNMDLTSIQGKFDIVNAEAFFHIFTRPKQLLAVQKVIGLLRPEPGSVVFGWQLGSLRPAQYELPKGSRFRHSPESFAELWKEAAASSGSQWKVDSSLDEVDMEGSENRPWAEPYTRVLVFTVTRL